MLLYMSDCTQSKCCCTLVLCTLKSIAQNHKALCTQHMTDSDECCTPTKLFPHFFQVANHRTSSMSSLNSQESSNDICKLTDKQQAEYHDAYREYIAQMAQLEMSGSGGERPVQPHPGQFLQAASSEDKGVGGQSQVHCRVFVTTSLMAEIAHSNKSLLS